MPTRKELVLDGIPRLADNATALDIAMWLLLLKRWAAAQSMTAALFGPIPDDPDDVQEEQIREGKRYLNASIANKHLAGDLADLEGYDHAMRGIDHIKEQWLFGKEPSEILTEHLKSLEWKPNASPQTFLAEFFLMINNIEPEIPAKRACEIFAERLPQSFDTYIHMSDQDPGRESVVRGGVVNHRLSTRKWCNKIISEYCKVELRNTARNRRRGGSLSDALATTTEHGNLGEPTWGERALCTTQPSAYDEPNTAEQILNALAAIIRRDQDDHRGRPRSQTPRLLAPARPAARPAAGLSTAATKPTRTCFNCGAENADHTAKTCPKEKQNCCHPLHDLLGSRWHLERFCPYYHPENIQNPELKKAVTLQLQIYEKGKEVAKSEKTAALATNAETICEEVEQLALDIEDMQSAELDSLMTIHVTEKVSVIHLRISFDFEDGGMLEFIFRLTCANLFQYIHNCSELFQVRSLEYMETMMREIITTCIMHHLLPPTRLVGYIGNLAKSAVDKVGLDMCCSAATIALKKARANDHEIAVGEVICHALLWVNVQNLWDDCSVERMDLDTTAPLVKHWQPLYNERLIRECTELGRTLENEYYWNVPRLLHAAAPWTRPDSTTPDADVTLDASAAGDSLAMPSDESACVKSVGKPSTLTMRKTESECNSSPAATVCADLSPLTCCDHQPRLSHRQRWRIRKRLSGSTDPHAHARRMMARMRWQSALAFAVLMSKRKRALVKTRWQTALKYVLKAERWKRSQQVWTEHMREYLQERELKTGVGQPRTHDTNHSHHVERECRGLVQPVSLHSTMSSGNTRGVASGVKCHAETYPLSRDVRLEQEPPRTLRDARPNPVLSLSPSPTGTYEAAVLIQRTFRIKTSKCYEHNTAERREANIGAATLDDDGPLNIYNRLMNLVHGAESGGSQSLSSSTDSTTCAACPNEIEISALVNNIQDGGQGGNSSQATAVPLLDIEGLIRLLDSSSRASALAVPSRAPGRADIDLHDVLHNAVEIWRPDGGSVIDGYSSRAHRCKRASASIRLYAFNSGPEPILQCPPVRGIAFAFQNEVSHWYEFRPPFKQGGACVKVCNTLAEALRHCSLHDIPTTFLGFHVPEGLEGIQVGDSVQDFLGVTEQHLQNVHITPILEVQAATSLTPTHVHVHSTFQGIWDSNVTQMQQRNEASRSETIITLSADNCARALALSSRLTCHELVQLHTIVLALYHDSVPLYSSAPKFKVRFKIHQDSLIGMATTLHIFLQREMGFVSPDHVVPPSVNDSPIFALRNMVWSIKMQYQLLCMDLTLMVMPTFLVAWSGSALPPLDRTQLDPLDVPHDEGAAHVHTVDALVTNILESEGLTSHHDTTRMYLDDIVATADGGWWYADRLGNTPPARAPRQRRYCPYRCRVPGSMALSRHALETCPEHQALQSSRPADSGFNQSVVTGGGRLEQIRMTPSEVMSEATSIGRPVPSYVLQSLGLAPSSDSSPPSPLRSPLLSNGAEISQPTISFAVPPPVTLPELELVSPDTLAELMTINELDSHPNVAIDIEALEQDLKRAEEGQTIVSALCTLPQDESWSFTTDASAPVEGNSSRDEQTLAAIRESVSVIIMHAGSNRTFLRLIDINAEPMFKHQLVMIAIGLGIVRVQKSAPWAIYACLIPIAAGGPIISQKQLVQLFQGRFSKRTLIDYSNLIDAFMTVVTSPCDLHVPESPPGLTIKPAPAVHLADLEPLGVVHYEPGLVVIDDDLIPTHQRHENTMRVRDITADPFKTPPVETNEEMAHRCELISNNCSARNLHNIARAWAESAADALQGSFYTPAGLGDHSMQLTRPPAYASTTKYHSLHDVPPMHLQGAGPELPEPIPPGERQPARRLAVQIDAMAKTLRLLQTASDKPRPNKHHFDSMIHLFPHVVQLGHIVMLWLDSVNQMERRAAQQPQHLRGSGPPCDAMQADERPDASKGDSQLMRFALRESEQTFWESILLGRAPTPRRNELFVVFTDGNYPLDEDEKIALIRVGYFGRNLGDQAWDLLCQRIKNRRNGVYPRDWDQLVLCRRLFGMAPELLTLPMITPTEARQLIVIGRGGIFAGAGDWSTLCIEIKAQRDGNYPPDWGPAVITGALFIYHDEAHPLTEWEKVPLLEAGPDSANANSDYWLELCEYIQWTRSGGWPCDWYAYFPGPHPLAAAPAEIQSMHTAAPSSLAGALTEHPGLSSVTLRLQGADPLHLQGAGPPRAQPAMQSMRFQGKKPCTDAGNESPLTCFFSPPYNDVMCLHGLANLRQTQLVPRSTAHIEVPRTLCYAGPYYDTDVYTLILGALALKICEARPVGYRSALHYLSLRVERIVTRLRMWMRRAIQRMWRQRLLGAAIVFGTEGVPRRTQDCILLPHQFCYPPAPALRIAATLSAPLCLRGSGPLLPSNRVKSALESLREELVPLSTGAQALLAQMATCIRERSVLHVRRNGFAAETVQRDWERHIAAAKSWIMPQGTRHDQYTGDAVTWEDFWHTRSHGWSHAHGISGTVLPPHASQVWAWLCDSTCPDVCSLYHLLRMFCNLGDTARHDLALTRFVHFVMGPLPPNSAEAHFDHYDAILMVLMGIKHIWIKPHEQLRNTGKGRSNENLHADPRHDLSWKYITLRAGDVLLLPAGVWHYVLSAPHTVMVNIWLYPRSKQLVAPNPSANEIPPELTPRSCVTLLRDISLLEVYDSAAARVARAATSEARKRRRGLDKEGPDLPCDECTSIPFQPTSVSAIRDGVKTFQVGPRGRYRESFDRVAQLQRCALEAAITPVAQLKGGYEFAVAWGGYDKMFTGSTEATLQTRPVSVLTDLACTDIELLAEHALRCLPAREHRLTRFIAVAQFTLMPPGCLRRPHWDPHLELGDVVATYTLCGSGWVSVGVQSRVAQQCSFWQTPGSCYTMTGSALHHDKHWVRAGDTGRFSLTLRFKVLPFCLPSQTEAHRRSATAALIAAARGPLRLQGAGPPAVQTAMGPPRLRSGGGDGPAAQTAPDAPWHCIIHTTDIMVHNTASTASRSSFSSRRPPSPPYRTHLTTAREQAIPECPYVVYLGSNKRRPNDFKKCMQQFKGDAILIDIIIGGEAHDLRNPTVVIRLTALCTHPLCIGVLVSLPCSTWSAALWNPLSEMSPAVKRTLDLPLGIPDANGNVPAAVADANEMTTLTMALLSTAIAAGKEVIMESPVSRAYGSPHAIRGREKHAAFWTHPDVIALTSLHGLLSVIFDQYLKGAPTQKTTELRCTRRIHAAVNSRLGGLLLDHVHGGHMECKQKTLLGRDDNGNFNSTQSQEYSAALNLDLAESFIDIAVEDKTLTIPASCTGSERVSQLAAPLLSRNATSVDEQRRSVLKLAERGLDALHTVDRSNKRDFINPDSGCLADVESQRGQQGFTGNHRSSPVTLTTGTNQKVRVRYEADHVQFFIDTKFNVVEDCRKGVLCTTGTAFDRCLWSPHTATQRGVSTMFTPSGSFLVFPDNKVVPITVTPHGYALERYFTREAAEHAAQKMREAAHTTRHHLRANTTTHAPSYPPDRTLPRSEININVNTNTTDAELTADPASPDTSAPEIDDFRHHPNDVRLMMHRRTAHRSPKLLDLINEHCTGIIIPPAKKSDFDLRTCDHCPAARGVRRSHPTTQNNPLSSRYDAIRSFGDCVARDLLGMLVPSFYHGYRWAHLFADVATGDFAGYCQVHKNAAECLATTKRYEADMAIYGTVKRYHQDGAKELIGKEMTEFCHNKKQPTALTWVVAEHSNFNPLAESGFWILFSMVRAMLIECGLPIEHWAVAFLYAVYIYRRLPKKYTRLNRVSTPYAMLTGGSKPSLKAVKIFGCMAHALLSPTELKRYKLQSRTVTGFFVGYSRTQVGGILIFVPGHPKYITAATVRVDESRLFKSLNAPRPGLGEAPVIELHPLQPPNTNAATCGDSSSNVSAPGSDSGGAAPPLADPEGAPPTPHAPPDAALMPPASAPMPEPTTHQQPLHSAVRLAEGTRVEVFGEREKWWPGTIIDRRPDYDGTIVHRIGYDGYKRKYWHNFDEESWRLITPSLLRRVSFGQARLHTTSERQHQQHNQQAPDAISPMSPSATALHSDDEQSDDHLDAGDLSPTTPETPQGSPSGACSATDNLDPATPASLIARHAAQHALRKPASDIQHDHDAAVPARQPPAVPPSTPDNAAVQSSTCTPVPADDPVQPHRHHHNLRPRGEAGRTAGVQPDSSVRSHTTGVEKSGIIQCYVGDTQGRLLAIHSTTCNFVSHKIDATEAVLGGTVQDDATSCLEVNEATLDALATRMTTKIVANDEGILETHRIPRSFREAMASPDKTVYVEAMEVEYKHHMRAGTWTLVEAPEGAFIIDCTWRFDLKLNADQTIKKGKARLCARGDEAREGSEFFFSYSSTAGLDIFRLFFATAAYRGWPVFEADYSTAYLNALLDTKVFMRQPVGFEQTGADGQRLVCMLLRAIYGLPQSGRLWQETHTAALIQLGFVQCLEEHALFKREDKDDVIYLMVNVDNLYFAASNDALRKETIGRLQEQFELNDLGIVEHTLGVRVRQNPKLRTTTLDQEQYINTTMKRFLPEGVKSRRKHTTPGDKDTITELKPLDAMLDRKGKPTNPEVLKWQKPCYRLGGSLNWIACFTRIDIAYYLNQCMRCAAGAHEAIYLAMLDILIFLYNTAGRKLTFGYNSDAHLRQLIIEGAEDIRHDVFKEGDPITFVDTGGGPRPMMCAIVTMFGGIVAARISRCTSTCLSVCEGEWFGATLGATILQALEPVLLFLKIDFSKPMLMMCDNKAACMLSDSNHTTKRMRHVATRLAYLQEMASTGKVCLIHIKTDANIADIGTKPLTARVFHHLSSYILTF